MRAASVSHFVDAHRLIAAFFGVIGIADHATVALRAELEPSSQPLGHTGGPAPVPRSERVACEAAILYGTQTAVRRGCPASLLAAPPNMTPMEQFHGTTIVSVRRKPRTATRSRSAATARSRSATSSSRARARKVRRLYHGKVLAGFAGATADAFTLFERFEAKLEKHQGHLVRAAIELAKDWRTDRVLRRLEAMLAVADTRAPR